MDLILFYNDKLKVNNANENTIEKDFPRKKKQSRTDKVFPFHPKFNFEILWYAIWKKGTAR